MISVDLMGGLCNQIFQIFATIAYSIETGNPFVFPYTTHLYAGITRPTYWDSFLKSLRQFTVENKRYNLNNHVLSSFPAINCHEHHYTPIPIISKNNSARLNGYFQSYKYFEKYEKIIYSMIQLTQQQLLLIQEYPQYVNIDNTYTISMHFRLGDYKNIQEYHNILGINYYKNAISHIISNISDSLLVNNTKVVVLFFCEKEDNAYVFSVISELNKDFVDIEFIKANDNIPDWKQMLLMSCCDSNIIANSSFSWCGAYFNQSSEKIVTYPSIWFGPNLSHNYLEDMFPVSWKKINV